MMHEIRDDFLEKFLIVEMSLEDLKKLFLFIPVLEFFIQVFDKQNVIGNSIFHDVRHGGCF